MNHAKDMAHALKALKGKHDKQNKLLNDCDNLIASIKLSEHKVLYLFDDQTTMELKKTNNQVLITIANIDNHDYIKTLSPSEIAVVADASKEITEYFKTVEHLL